MGHPTALVIQSEKALPAGNGQAVMICAAVRHWRRGVHGLGSGNRSA
ncbi:hypothetical protein LMG29542_07305 [Paraburkholderia humisilvae]|uniref:Uncharacterized protein n=1 Tax=Paraburkholderia humisilvae TaxID=627669 RepID=A0A6J5F6Z4_9BURK|nr:hypothetical protein LMG29542_07305 [Paraburkholderia humisilvae]